jgi:hypothetical protein
MHTLNAADCRDHSTVIYGCDGVELPVIEKFPKSNEWGTRVCLKRRW